MVTLLIACIVDGELNKPTGEPTFDTGEPIDLDQDVDEDACDGVDNDGDGVVDDGFDDLDGNGRTDCLDLECPALDAGVEGPTDDVCTTTPGDPWDVEVKWTYVASGDGVAQTPMVGNLTDDNLDGVIDAEDVPDVVFTTWASDTLVGLSGDDGHVLFEYTGYSGYYGVAIADVDGDGESEIIASNTNYQVVVVNADGTTEWISAGQSAPLYPTVADLDGDGRAEIIANGELLDGENGHVLATFTGSFNFDVPVVADLDGDGSQEFMFHHTGYDSAGTELWSHVTIWTATDYTAIADVNVDGSPDVVSIAVDDVNIYDRRGILQGTFVVPELPVGPQAIADFDGDDVPEIAMAGDGWLLVLELDGTELWRMASPDDGFAAPSAFDFDGDGIYEVLFAGEDVFRIYDGRTGAVRYEDTSHRSFTQIEYPVIADVDHDGHSEVLVAGSQHGGGKGITVYGSREGWPASGPTWGEYAYTTTALEDDGSIPADPEPSWLTDNLFRARPATDTSGPDLVVTFTDVCVADCVYGPVAVAVQVSNRGGTEVPAGQILSLYAVDSGVEREVGVEVLPAVPPRTSLAGISFALTVADLGADGWIARVDESDSLIECDETNNVATQAPTCP